MKIKQSVSCVNKTRNQERNRGADYDKGMWNERRVESMFVNKVYGKLRLEIQGLRKEQKSANGK